MDTKILQKVKQKSYAMSNTLSHQTKPSASKLNVINYAEEGLLTEWLALHGKTILYVLGGLVATLAIVFTLSSRHTSQSEQDYIHAANDFALISSAATSYDSPAAQEALTRLQQLMQKHTELQAAYEAALAQILLNQSQVAEAIPYANATLARVQSNDLTFYTEYAATTLLISQQNYPQALANSQSLQQKMEENLSLPSDKRAFGEELFALNLLRIGILQQSVGDAAGELKTWQTWKQYAGLNGAAPSAINPQAFRALVQELAIGSVSLPDYIAHRENLLKKP